MTTEHDIPERPKELVAHQGVAGEPLPGEAMAEVGQWFWVKDTDRNGKPCEWLGCITAIGSNYIDVTSPRGGHERVHFNDFEKILRREMEPDAVIRGNIAEYHDLAQEKLREINAITMRLGVTSHQKIEHKDLSSSRALSTLSGTDDVKKYKKDLVKAKEKLLPKLFEEVKDAHENMAIWMKARSLPLQAAAEGMKDCVEEIEDRIFNVSLYAGLTEAVKQVSDGEPAEIGERLRIFQRMLFMDEEALLNYKTGGMDFDGIGEFDRWLAKPVNRDRVFPFPRAMVAFRVRRETKERDWGGDLGKLYINIEMGELDKATFLYIRNGDRLYRMACDLDFDELIFPGKNELNLNEPMMVAKFAGHIEEDKIITRREWEVLVKEDDERQRKADEWTKANPGKHQFDAPQGIDFHSPFYRLDEYQPFDKSSVYFDDIAEVIAKRVKYYNRIVLIVQGLYDRSEILHPHPPVRLWKEGGFEAAVELVYDGSNLLHYGQPPDFEEYRKRCNESLKVGCMTVGQDMVFLVREAAKYNARFPDRNYQSQTHRPYGNPGPGYLAKVEAWSPKSRTATFRWTRERQTSNYYESKHYGDPIPTSMTCNDKHLFNVNAYNSGDYKQFFVDPRTRAHYLQWAPMLLAAEEWHAGNRKFFEKKKE